MCELSRRRTVADNDDIKIPIADDPYGSNESAVDPVVRVTEGAAAETGEENAVRDTAFGVQ